MRRQRPSHRAALVAALTTASLVVAQVPPRRVLPDEAAAAVRAATGHEPFAIFAAWARGELGAGMEKLFDERGERLERAFRAAAVCGLWSDDPDVAFGAACHVLERALDVADIDRYVAITMPRLFDESLRFDWDTFKHVLSTAQVERVLGLHPGGDCDARYMFVMDLHRSMRAAHVPALCLRVRDDDPFVRRQAFDVLANLALHTAEHRETIALMLLGWPGPSAFELGEEDDPDGPPRYVPRGFTLPPAADGYPPILRALLRRWFLEHQRDVKYEKFDAWLMRWADDERPGVEDRALLIELLGAARVRAQWTALRALRRLPPSDASDAALRRYLVEGAAGALERSLAQAALRALDELRVRAVESPSALAVALDIGDEPAWESWCARAFGADADVGLAALRQLDDARDESHDAPVRFPDAIHARLRELAAERATGLDARRLACLVRTFPGCRSPALLEARLAALGPGDVADCDGDGLELLDAARFRARLVAILPDCAGPARDAALGLLAGLGAPEVGAELVAWAGDDADRIGRLARSAASPAVRAALVERLRGFELVIGAERIDAPPEFAALAVANGVPAAAAVHWAGAITTMPHETLRAAWPRWVAGLADGAGVELLCDALDAQELPDLFEGLADVADPRALAHLRRLRDRPGADVQDVLAELAIAGEPDAVAELAEVRARHLYGWMDDAGLRHRTSGPTLALVPYWIGEIGTVCCRRNGAAWAIDGLTGFDASEVAEEGLVTQQQHAQAWWARVGSRLRWSESAGRFAVGPR